MSIDPAANDLLTRSGAPSAKFPTIGTTVKGTILGAEKSQQTDIDGNPLTWDNGEPRWQVVITVQTEDRDTGIDGDTGERRIFAKSQMLSAIKQAIREAKASGLDVGGTLAVKYEADGEAKPGRTAQKLYRAQYVPPPAVALSGDDLI